MLQFNRVVSAQGIHGFTLIELLIVLSILGVLGSLVGPVGFAQYQRAMALEERQQLTTTIQLVQNEAFRRRTQIEVVLADSYLDILLADDELSRQEFDLIQFEPQTLSVSSHAIWSDDVLVWQEAGVRKELRLNRPSLMDELSDSSTMEFAR